MLFERLVVNETSTVITSDNPVTRFPSLTVLRATHTDLLKRHRKQDNTSELLTEVAAFIRQGMRSARCSTTRMTAGQPKACSITGQRSCTERSKSYSTPLFPNSIHSGARVGRHPVSISRVRRLP